jgi:Fur family transcriptional regulator, zinc uptake regulator
MRTCTSHAVCVEDALHVAERICAEKNVRFTPLRRTVLEMIWEHHGPAKAYDLLDKLKKEDASAKPPTVYRTLDFLLENGLAHKLSSLNAYVGCSHPLKAHACYFLMCTECGGITECCNSTLAQAITETARKNRFTPRRITLEIEGVCEECRTP